MPELDAEHRDQMALTLFDLGLDTSEDWWNRQADALAPLVAGWLADARADALREAADELAPIDDSAWWAPARWLRDRADRGGDIDKPRKDGED